MGLADLASGLLLLFTASPIPAGIAEIHAIFLIVKGLGTMIRALPLPTPFYYLGGPADLISASILLVGQPPLFAEYKSILAGILMLKGLWSSFSLMKYL
ncbi:MAG: hypothetical protein ABEK16_00640 [Candidatus Nanohalobium sp.]